LLRHFLIPFLRPLRLRSPSPAWVANQRKSSRR
jgi:hypothetical protein